MRLEHLFLRTVAERSTFVRDALVYAANAHNSIDQRRKFTGRPYTDHTEAVAGLVALCDPTNEVLIVAAILHDVVEDVPGHTIDNISSIFGNAVGDLVKEVTDVYAKEAYPHLNRTERHAMERARLSMISLSGKMIKLADLIDNLSDIRQSNPGFAVTYFEEKRALMSIFISAEEFKLLPLGFQLIHNSIELLLAA
jgi:guanosine-3',5'-bis(diphosphate) 3'-pyrophosphohydrolase